MQALYTRSPGNISVRILLLPRSVFKISIRGLSWRDLLMRSLCKLSKRVPLAKCLRQISKSSLTKRSLKEVSRASSLRKLPQEVSWQDLCKRPLGKISTDLYASSLYKISIRSLLATSLYKLPEIGLLVRSVEEISAQAESSWQDLCTRSL